MRQPHFHEGRGNKKEKKKKEDKKRDMKLYEVTNFFAFGYWMR